MANSYIDMKKVEADRKAHIFVCIIGFIVFVYLCARLACCMDALEEDNVITALMYLIPTFHENLFACSFGPTFWKMFGLFGIIVLFILNVMRDKKMMNAHYTATEQCGTAQWQTVQTIKNFNCVYNAPKGKPEVSGDENTIYSKNCYVTMNTRQTGLNNNSMIIGGPGSGKSFNIVRPNLMQLYGSYVVTDPSGELMATTGKLFEENGYKIQVFNLVDMAHSNCYNPFAYLRGEEDVLTLISCLIKNTEGGKSSGDPFWEKSETALLEAIIFYLIRWQKEEFRNFTMVSNLLRQAKVDPKTTSSQLDALFNEVRQYDANDICVKQYDIFKQASDKTAQSILITAAVRLAPFNIRAVENLTSKDEMNLAELGDKKTITYIIVPQGNNPYAFLVNMMYSQMFDSLYNHAATDCEGLRLKYDVRFILDEFANIGVIPDFQVKLTTMRKYGLSVMIFIQAVGQIKNLYKDDWETLMGACDTLVYLGGNELSSMEDLSKKLGVQTIRTKDTSTSKSAKGGSDSKSFKYTKRELLTVDEIRRLKKGFCIVVVKGEQPFYDEKYSTFDHPRSKFLGNLGDGTGLYRFDYCNTRGSDTTDLDRRLKFMQEHALKKSEVSKRPENKQYQQQNPTPSSPDLTEDQIKKTAQNAGEKVAIPTWNMGETTKSGATITTHSNGLATVQKPTAKPTTTNCDTYGKKLSGKITIEGLKATKDKVDAVLGGMDALANTVDL